MKRLLGNLLMMLISVSVCLAAAEVSLRAFWPQIQNLNVKYDLRENDPELGAVSRAGLDSRMEVLNTFNVGLRTNSVRLRGTKEYAVDKAPGVTRVLFLGDSFTFGWGLEDDETWPALLEKDLNADGGHYEVLNAGVYAFDTGHYLRWFRRFARYAPDLVIVGFCLENDFDLALRDAAERDAGRAESASGTPFVSGRVYQWVKQHVLLRSHVLAFFRDRLYVLFPDIRKYLFYLGVTDKREIFLTEYPERLKARLEGVERNLRTLRDEVEAAGGRLVIAAVPLREQIYSAEAIDHFAGFDVQKPDKELAAMCERLGVPLLDLTDAFLARAARGERLYYETDPHWNPAGSAAAAEALAGFLRSGAGA